MIRYSFSTCVHGIEIIENYNPLADLWHGAERVQSLHGYLPINITIGLEEHPFISYDTLGGIDSVLLKIHVFFFLLYLLIFIT